MQLRFRSNDAHGARWRVALQHHLAHALRHLRQTITGLQVELDDGHGRTAGVDKRCQATARMRDGTTLRTAVAARQWRDAVRLAVQALRKQVLEHLRGHAQGERLLALQGAPRTTHTITRRRG